VADFFGEDGQRTRRSQDIADYVALTFVNAREFKVSDRSHFERIIKEQKTQNSGTFDESTAVQIGKMLGADLMIVGRVQQDDFVTQNGPSIPLPGRTSLKNTKSNYILAVAISVIDPKTGNTIDQYVQTTELNDSRTGFIVNPGSMPREEAQRKALEKFGADFMHNINPYTLEEVIKLKADGSFNKDLDQAIARANLGEMDEAVAMIKGITERDLKAASKHKANYNYGLILLAKGDCKEALRLFREAYLANPDTEEYLEAFNKAKAQCAQEEKAK
jgi:tetratricopeptide (TPR) repeat protein